MYCFNRLWLLFTHLFTWDMTLFTLLYISIALFLVCLFQHLFDAFSSLVPISGTNRFSKVKISCWRKKAICYSCWRFKFPWNLVRIGCACFLLSTILGVVGFDDDSMLAVLCKRIEQAWLRSINNLLDFILDSRWFSSFFLSNFYFTLGSYSTTIFYSSSRFLLFW